jgi:hypothetical protein
MSKAASSDSGRVLASTSLYAEAVAAAHSAAARAAIGADIPGRRADAHAIEASATAAGVHGIGAWRAESEAAAASLLDACTAVPAAVDQTLGGASETR